MNRGMKNKVKAWIYTRVLGDMRSQLWELSIYFLVATPIIVMQQFMWIFNSNISMEEKVLMRLSGYATNVLLMLTGICLLIQICRVVENKRFCLGLIIIAITATISCILYKGFLTESMKNTVTLKPCAVPYLVSVVVVWITYRHIWKIMMS